jgi:hypothetical protein
MSIGNCPWLYVRCLFILIASISISICIIGNREPVRVLPLIAIRHVVVGLRESGDDIRTDPLALVYKGAVWSITIVMRDYDSCASG